MTQAAIMRKSLIADLSTGFAGLAVVIAGFLTGALSEDLRAQVIVVGGLFFIAGLLRGASVPSNSWIKGFAVALGSGVPVCIMAITGAAFTSRPHLIAFLTTSLLSAVAGASVRKFWRSGHRAAGASIAAFWAFAVIAVVQLFVPLYLESFFTQRVSYPAPPFAFRSINGNRITNQTVRGRVAVLAFWATWCAPCRQELPRLNALYKRYEKDPNVAFLAVADERDEFAPSVNKASRFFSMMRLSLPLAIRTANESTTLRVTILPTLIILDPQGNVRVVHTGYDGAERLENMVNNEIVAASRSAHR